MSRAVACALSLVFIFGCQAPNTAVHQPYHLRTYHAGFDRITPDGTVILKNGETLRLAGIRMRPVKETQEPELLDVVNDIVTRESRTVRIERDPATNSAVAYYKQRVNYLPDFWLPRSMFMNALRLKTTGTVNEVLILMAAAKYDSTVGRMSQEARLRCEEASAKAEEAFWSRWRARPLREYKLGSGQLYTNETGYRARIAKGDIPAWRRAMAEYEAKVAAMGCGDWSTRSPPAPNLTLECAAKLCRALSDDNVVVRRYAALLLRRVALRDVDKAVVSALVVALHDEDRWVRAWAAHALGDLRVADAKGALEQTAHDRDKEVRQAAKKALHSLD